MSPAIQRRNTVREERHPNAATAPLIHRGSMTPLPWRGFWNSLGSAALAKANAWLPPREPAQPKPAPAAWQQAAQRRRAVLAALIVLWTVLASVLFAHLQPAGGNAWLQGAQLVLFVVLSAWVVVGFVTAWMGFWVLLFGDRHALSAQQVVQRTLNPDKRIAIIMPICNEDVPTVFAGLRATCESLAATGHARAFDVFVLSDSHNPALAAAEKSAWAQLRSDLSGPDGQAPIEVYYRLRTRRRHRKAGNVADFCRRWGKDYDSMVVLDADSVMSGQCLVNLAKLLDANPSAGIIQTATQAIGHATLHARVQQFGSRVTGRLFTLGMQFWQLGESHYWGHNAIIRMQPFMQHCALAPIEGSGGMAGGIMSHDFVEAALMRRAGYHVWLVSDLTGSYEQQPPDLLSELQRDRRWCQGNLQNSRLCAEPGIHRVHRAMFVVGAMSYLSAPLWLAFLSVGTALWMHHGGGAGLEQGVSVELLSLWALTVCLLFMPRVLGLAAVFMKREQKQFGGGLALVVNTGLEALLAVLQAPVRMLGHSLFVLIAITGWKLEWQSPPREANGVAWSDALRQLSPMTLAALVAAIGMAMFNALALLWLTPVALPLVLAIPLTVLTSHVPLGVWLRARGVLIIPEESWAPAVLRRARRHASRLALKVG